MRYVLLLLTFVVTASCTTTTQLGSRQYSPSDCKFYIRPVREPLPALPNIDDLTGDELNIAQAKYINRLRQYVAMTRLKEEDHYLQYLRLCVR